MLSRSGKVSIRDVAVAAGVSPTTVSQILNGRDAERFTAGTLERVRQAAEQLGYRPHPLARSLIRGRTESIGIMVSGLQNPFFVELLEAAIDAVIAHGYAPLLSCGPSVHGSYGGHSRINEWLVDGVLMWCEANEALCDYILESDSRVPVCYMSSFARDDDADLIELDVVRGAREVARHLGERGYRRIAYVTPFPPSAVATHEKRLIGFQQAMDECGAALSMTHFPTPGPTRQRGLEAGIAIASLPAGRRPEALLCHNDITAIGVMNGLRRAGLKVPEDIAVAGYGGLEEGRWFDHALTTMVIPMQSICQLAVGWLVSRIEGSTEPRHHELIAPQLRVGETT